MVEQGNKQSIETRQSSKEIFAGYKGGEEMPLAGYAALLGIFNAAFLTSLLAAARPESSLEFSPLRPFRIFCIAPPTG